MTTEPFREFVLAHNAGLHRTAVLLTRDPHAAHDLLQEALLRAWRRWDRVTDNPAGYVRTILLREFLTDRRRRWHGEVPTEQLPEQAAGDDVPPEAQLDLAQAVGELPAQQRAVVVLRYFHDLTVEDTATTMGISPGTVKSHHARAMRALRISTHLDDDVASEGRGR